MTEAVLQGLDRMAHLLRVEEVHQHPLAAHAGTLAAVASGFRPARPAIRRTDSGRLDALDRELAAR